MPGTVKEGLVSSRKGEMLVFINKRQTEEERRKKGVETWEVRKHRSCCLIVPVLFSEA